MSTGKLNNGVRKIYHFIIITIIIISSIYFLHNAYTGNTGYSPKQPDEFLHTTHVEKFGIKCLFCHYSADNESYSLIPTTKDCMTCHIAFKVEDERFAQLNKSFDEEIPIIRSSVYTLPDFVRFDHSGHVGAKIDCSSCHGEVETKDKISQTRRLTMKWCIDCHRKPYDYIIPARAISGIFIKDSIRFNNKGSITEPDLGIYKNPKIKFVTYDISYRDEYGRGPLNCFSCHY